MPAPRATITMSKCAHAPLLYAMGRSIDLLPSGLLSIYLFVYAYIFVRLFVCLCVSACLPACLPVCLSRCRYLPVIWEYIALCRLALPDTTLYRFKDTRIHDVEIHSSPFHSNAYMHPRTYARMRACVHACIRACMHA